MTYRTVFSDGEGFGKVTVIVIDEAKYRVTYGKQVRDCVDYEHAARELGYAILHRLACDGLLPDDE